MALEVLKPTEDELNDKAVLNFYNAFYSCFKNAKSPLGDFLFNELQKGEKTLYNKSVVETKIFDGSFINVVINAYPSILKICRDPKKTLSYMQEVVAMEKAKKVDSESIRHLASHTQFIRDIKENEEVIPSKILTTYADDNLGIYENRFIKTLVNRVITFLDTRLKLMNENLESINADEIRYKNNIKLSHKKIDLQMSIKLSNEQLDETKKAREIYEKTKDALDKYRALKGTGLYQACAKLKDVVPPIMKTNIILHNPDFKIAYNLWIYIDRTNEIGYKVESSEADYNDDNEIVNEFDHIGVALINSIFHQRGLKELKINEEGTVVRDFKKDEETKYELTPKDVKLEHQEINEYLLSRISEIYEEKYQEALSQGLSFEMSVKRVSREMITTINRLFPSLFDVNEDDMKKTPELLERMKRKQKVMRLVKEQKQLDLNKMERDSISLDNNIKNLEDYLKRQEKRRKEREKKEKERIERLNKQIQAKRLREQKRQELQKQKEERARLRQELLQKKEEERLKKEELAKLEEESQKAKQIEGENILEIKEPEENVSQETKEIQVNDETKDTLKEELKVQDKKPKKLNKPKVQIPHNDYLEDLDNDVVIRYDEDSVIENNRKNYPYEEDIDNEVVIRLDENEVVENLMESLNVEGNE